MSGAHVTSQPAGRSFAERIREAARSAVTTEVGLARTALAVVGLHIADDNFLQPNPGMSASDHLVGGLVLLGLVVAAAVFYPRVRAGARGLIALSGGFLGVLVGTEAVYYTSEVGPSGDDFTGLLSIPAGLTLLGLGGYTLWRSRRTEDARWWRYLRRLLYLGAAYLVFASVLFISATAYVFTHAARAEVPAADLGAPYESVEFETSDGLTLKGWYVRSKNGAAVISFPGRASSQSRAKMLADHGYGVLVFDRRGEGVSDGDPNIFGWQGERDIHAAVAFLQRQADVDPDRIGGIGLSVGGEMMIEAAAESPALKAIVSEGASSRSIHDERANEGGTFEELFGVGLTTAATSLFTSDLPPADLKGLAAKVTGAQLFVYGEEGQPAEEPANRGFYEAARGPREIWEVPGSGHMKGMEAQPQEYERRVVGFFDRALLGERPMP